MTHRRDLTGRTTSLATLGAVALVISLLDGCSKPGRELQPGSYRATVTLAGDRQVPFGLDVGKDEHGLAVALVNGDERVRLAKVHVEPGRLDAAIATGGSLTASVSGGRLHGSLTLAAPQGRMISLPFDAELGKTHRFFESPLTDNADFAGRWSITLADDQGATTRGVLDIRQKFETVMADVSLPGGKSSRLAGEAHDEELRLARCDGSVALLYHGRLDAKGALAGESWSAAGEHLRFRAERNPAASLDEAAAAAGE